MPNSRTHGNQSWRMFGVRDDNAIMENSFSLLSRVKSTGRAFGQHCRSAKANGNVPDGEFDAGIFRRKLHRVLPRRKCDFGLIGKAKCGHRFVVLQKPSSPRGEQFQLSQSRSMRIVTFTHCPIPISLAFAKPTATRQTSPREKGANKHPFCGSQKGDSRKTRGFSRAPAPGDIGLFCPHLPFGEYPENAAVEWLRSTGRARRRFNR